MDYTSELGRFPQVVLPVESTVNSAAAARESNAVHLAQPCGKRAYAWFTYHKSKNVCFLLDIKNREPCNLYPVHAAFQSRLSLGTVLHGTVVQHGGHRCFFADNIFFLEGRAVEAPFSEKLKIMERLLRTGLDSQGALYLPSQVLFYVCPYSYFPTAFQVPFKLFCVKAVNLATSKTVHYADETRAFKVRRTDVCDTYELVDDAGAVQGLAGVNTYACSTALRRLFANGGAPDAASIDAIEESDDEYPDVAPVEELKLLCRWNPRLKHWTPVVQ